MFSSASTHQLGVAVDILFCKGAGMVPEWQAAQRFTGCMEQTSSPTLPDPVVDVGKLVVLVTSGSRYQSMIGAKLAPSVS